MVTLSGQVDSGGTKRRAQQLVAQIDGRQKRREPSQGQKRLGFKRKRVHRSVEENNLSPCDNNRTDSGGLTEWRLTPAGGRISLVRILVCTCRIGRAIDPGG